MAITAATKAYNIRPTGNVKYTDFRLTAGATGLIYAGTYVGVVLGTGTLRYADDVAALVPQGIAADTVFSAPNNPVATDRLRVIRPGAYVWSPDTTDTLTVAHIGKNVFIDDAGDAQKVEVVNGLSNVLFIVGIMRDFGTAEVLVDTTLMGVVAASIDL